MLLVSPLLLLFQLKIHTGGMVFAAFMALHFIEGFVILVTNEESSYLP